MSSVSVPLPCSTSADAIPSWLMLKYPMPKEKRAALVKLYFEVATLPGMHSAVINVAVEGLSDFTRSKKKLTINDLRMPWKPIYELLSDELFLPRRKFELKCVINHLQSVCVSLTNLTLSVKSLTTWAA